MRICANTNKVVAGVRNSAFPLINLDRIRGVNLHRHRQLRILALVHSCVRTITIWADSVILQTNDADAYCAYIRKLFASWDEYLRLASSAFREYSERLNWTVTGKRVRDFIEEAVPDIRRMQSRHRSSTR
jgi:hypothetical protein